MPCGQRWSPNLGQPVGLFKVGGVVDVRSEKLQSVEEIEAIGAAGARLIAPGRIALNPDCGSAPDFGEPPTIDEAFEKLRRMCQAAQRLRERFKKSKSVSIG